MENVIQVENLERTFGDLRAVDGITFEVRPGEVFGLLGPNGAGKTTTIRLLNGILPPSGGSARVLKWDPAIQGNQLRRNTGVLTETPAIYERLTAYDNLRFFGTLAGVPDDVLAQRLNRLLDFFALTDRAGDRTETYSKGMKQRLALARALIHEPPLLFLDEPTAGLDPEAAQQVNSLIENLSHKDGRTIVLCTHNLAEAQRLCDRVAVMNRGRILALGSLEELARHLWPIKWVDIRLWQVPVTPVAGSLKTVQGVRQVEVQGDSLAVQVDREEIIPEVIRDLVGRNVPILSVNPRDYSLEDIYFALQKKEGDV